MIQINMFQFASIDTAAQLDQLEPGAVPLEKPIGSTLSGSRTTAHSSAVASRSLEMGSPAEVVQGAPESGQNVYMNRRARYRRAVPARGTTRAVPRARARDMISLILILNSVHLIRGCTGIRVDIH